jgi:hypothetical protein
MRFTARARLNIACDPEQAFDAAADPRLLLDDPRPSRVELLSGEPVGPESHFRVEDANGAVWFHTYSVFDRPQRLVCDGMTNGVSTAQQIDFRPEDGGTLVETSLEFNSAWWAAAFGLLARRRIRNSLQDWLVALQTYCEAP